MKSVYNTESKNFMKVLLLFVNKSKNIFFSTPSLACHFSLFELIESSKLWYCSYIRIKSSHQKRDFNLSVTIVIIKNHLWLYYIHTYITINWTQHKINELNLYLYFHLIIYLKLNCLFVKFKFLLYFPVLRKSIQCLEIYPFWRN